MVFKSINPKNGRLLKTYDCISNNQLNDKLEKSIKVFKYMKNQGPEGVTERFDKFAKVKALMLQRK